MGEEFVGIWKGGGGGGEGDEGDMCKTGRWRGWEQKQEGQE